MRFQMGDAGHKCATIARARGKEREGEEAVKRDASALRLFESRAASMTFPADCCRIDEGTRAT